MQRAQSSSGLLLHFTSLFVGLERESNNGKHRARASIGGRDRWSKALSKTEIRIGAQTEEANGTYIGHVRGLNANLVLQPRLYARKDPVSEHKQVRYHATSVSGTIGTLSLSFSHGWRSLSLSHGCNHTHSCKRKREEGERKGRKGRLREGAGGGERERETWSAVGVNSRRRLNRYCVEDPKLDTEFPKYTVSRLEYDAGRPLVRRGGRGRIREREGT